MFIDFHTHFLHGIDDGAYDLETGLAMLLESYRQGTEYVVASPHFYSDKISINEACETRDNALSQILNYAQSKDLKIPHIIRGFEVSFNNDLKDMTDLKKLCIEGTDCMLVEMPYAEWDEQTFEELYNLTLTGVKPVIAHVDRYYKLFGKSVYRLSELDLYFQFNCDSLQSLKCRSFIRSLMSSGRICTIGTDMHNITSRPCDIEKAYKKAARKLSQYADDLFYANAYRILFENRN